MGSYTAINLNGSLPAAPTGSSNVTWQEDASGNVSAYVLSSSALLPAVDTTGLVANVAATTLLAATATGMYRVSGYIVITTVDGVSSTLPKITITWTDANNSTVQSFDLTATSAGNTLTTSKQGVMVVNALTATNIQYATSGYASGTPATMTYALHLKIEKLF